jgi:hypothetical protein
LRFRDKKVVGVFVRFSCADSDMIVMYHEFGWQVDGAKSKSIQNGYASGKRPDLYCNGKTVLPVAMATLLILNGRITTPGVQLPIRKCINRCWKLEEYGVVFKELPWLIMVISQTNT